MTQLPSSYTESDLYKYLITLFATITGTVILLLLGLLLVTKPMTAISVAAIGALAGKLLMTV